MEKKLSKKVLPKKSESWSLEYYDKVKKLSIELGYNICGYKVKGKPCIEKATESGRCKRHTRKPIEEIRIQKELIDFDNIIFEDKFTKCDDICYRYENCKYKRKHKTVCEFEKLLYKEHLKQLQKDYPEMDYEKNKTAIHTLIMTEIKAGRIDRLATYRGVEESARLHMAKESDTLNRSILQQKKALGVIDNKTQKVGDVIKKVNSGDYAVPASKIMQMIRSAQDNENNEQKNNETKTDYTTKKVKRPKI